MLYRNNIDFLFPLMYLYDNNKIIHNQFTVTTIGISAGPSFWTAIWIFFQSKNPCLQSIDLILRILRDLLINILINSFKTLYLIFDYPYKYYTFKHFEV